MRRMKRINYIKALMLTAIVVFAACSDQSEQTEEMASEHLQLAGLTRTPMKTEGTPGVYDANEDYSLIQVYMAYDSGINEGQFGYDPDTKEWSSNIGIMSGRQYYVYGFSPATAATGTISSTDYSQGATLTLNGLKTVTADDVCVVVGVQSVSNRETAPDWGTNCGQFGFQALGKGENFICLLLDHLFAGINFKIKVEENYNDRRTIKLKKMKLNVTGYATANVTIKLKKTDNGSDPIDIITYEQTGNSQSADLFDAEDGDLLELSTTEQSITGSLWPTLNKKMVLVSTYNVYDKKGTCVRENCVSENAIDLNKVSGFEMKHGNQVTISLTVEPTYLYQLSEPELDNPTIVVNSE